MEEKLYTNPVLSVLDLIHKVVEYVHPLQQMDNAMLQLATTKKQMQIVPKVHSDQLQQVERLFLNLQLLDGLILFNSLLMLLLFATLVISTLFKLNY